MKDRLLVFLCFLILLLIMPLNVMAKVSYKGNMVDNYIGTDGKKVYTYELKIVFDGNHSINHLEGLLKLTNLEVISFEPNSSFITDFNKSTLKYNMTSKTMFTSDFVYARVTVKQVNPMLDCHFNFEPLDTDKVNINEFNLKKQAYKDGKIVTQVKQGEEFQYKITVTSNNNALETDEVTLSDDIPSELEIISAPGGSIRGNSITWNLGKFAPGTSTKEFTINVRAKKDVKGLVNNVAVLEVGDKTIKDEVPVTIAYSEIKITKKASRSKVTAGQDFYYTIEVANVGNAESDNVTVEDTLDSNLTFVSATISHKLVNGKYIFDLGTIQANRTKTIRIDVKVNSGVTVSSIPNTAIAKEGSKEPVDDDVDVEVVKEEVKPNFGISKSVSTTKVKAGEEFKYTISVSNKNELNLIDLKVTDKFDNHLTIVDADGGTIKEDNSVEWKLDLGPNETKQLIVSVKAKNYSGTVKNSAVVTYEDTPITSNEVVVEIEQDPDLPPEEPEPTIYINKSVSATKVKAGEEFKYTISVSNGNVLNLTNVKLSDKFANHLVIVDAGSGKVKGNNVEWTFDLGPNETKQFVVVVKARNYNGVVKNSAVVTYEDKKITSNEVEVEIIMNSELPPDDPNDIPNPKTGNVMYLAIVAVCTLISLVILYFVKLKKKLYRI